MKRQPGIDLIRCVGLLFVVSVHHFLYNGFYSRPQVGLLMWTADTWRWLFFCCNGIFMMLTGYLKSTKPFNKGYYKGLLPVLIGYVLCCFLIFPLQSQLITEKLSFQDWMEKLVGFGNYAWYVEMYIGLILFSPVLNLAISNIREEKHMIGLAIMTICLTALPSATVLTFAPDFWTGFYPVTYYVLGAVIRRLQPKVKWWQGLSFAMLVSMGLAGVSILTTDKGFSSGFTQGYGGFWTTLVTLGVFLGLYRINPGEKLSKALKWASGGVYEGFMLTLIPDLWLYPMVKQWHKPEKWILVYVCVTIPIFFFALFAGKLIHTASEKISKWIFRLADQRRSRDIIQS